MVKPEMFFKNERRQKQLLTITIALFLCLAAETVFSGLVAVNESGGTHIDFHLKPTKLMSEFIYLSVAFLLYKKVNYKLLLIPDFFLLGIKLYTAISCCLHLFSTDTVGTYRTLTELENIIENSLFCLFLITLFACKLIPSKESVHLKLPYICMGSLALCFPFTLFFEAAKVFSETTVHVLTLKAALFNFFVGIMNEIFLDLPYALLLLVIFYVPQKNGHREDTASD